MSAFTEEELALAKTADLVDVAAQWGYTPRKIGNFHTLKEMDSLRIYNRRSWCRFSRRYDRGVNGGSQIDFLRVFAGMEVKEAVLWLLDFIGYRRDMQPVENRKWKTTQTRTVQKPQEEKKPFVLPKKAMDARYLYEYLTQERGISKETIDYFYKKGLIYESRPYHNIVFLGNDSKGVTRFASQRGVFDREGKSFKCDVAGNDKRYGFNLTNESSKEIVVFEAAIDLMSYVELYRDFDTNMLALGMLGDEPLLVFLEDHPQIQSIRFCLDNDVPGREATDRLMQKYYELGYEVEDRPPPHDYKDYNEWLVNTQKELEMYSNKEKVLYNLQR